METQECYVFPLWLCPSIPQIGNRYDFCAGKFVISLVRIEEPLWPNGNCDNEEIHLILKDQSCDGWALAVHRLPEDKDKTWDAVEEKYYWLIRTFLSSLTVVSGSIARALDFQPPIGVLSPAGLVSLSWPQTLETL